MDSVKQDGKFWQVCLYQRYCNCIVQMKESCYAWKESDIDCPLYYSLKLHEAPLGAMIPNSNT